MKCNVGRTDQTIRVILGLVIIILGLYFRKFWALFGLISITEGLIRYCPLNDMLGISTYNSKPYKQ